MKTLFWQFSRFFMVGAATASIQFFVLIGLVEIYSVKTLAASTIGYLSGALSNYLLNHYVTFKSSLPHRQTVVRFSINSLFGLLLNFALMTLFLTHYPYIWSQIASSFVILIWNFTIHRYWTFQPKKPRQQE